MLDGSDDGCLPHQCPTIASVTATVSRPATGRLPTTSRPRCSGGSLAPRVADHLTHAHGLSDDPARTCYVDPQDPPPSVKRFLVLTRE